MEKNIRTKLDHYSRDFKDNLKRWIDDNNATIIINTETGQEEKTNAFIQYMFDYPVIELSKTDFQKRKRIKNNVPDYSRCIALKCNGDRCSRKQKDINTHFCGTHMKGSPYGTVEQQKNQVKKEQVKLWLQEINGISRYIDEHTNIYCTEDIINSCVNPRIIGNYKICENGFYYMVKT